MKTVEDPTPSVRFRALDGIRGLAALGVVIHHSMLVIPSLAAVYGAGNERSPYASPLDSLVAYTPIHTFWLGAEYVWLFFILSGFVLTLPYRGDRRFSSRAYYPRRLLRLYLPATAAFLFSIVLALVVPRPGSDFSLWMQSHRLQDPLPTLRDAALIFGGSSYNAPFWSLQMEVLFSLFLPFALFMLGRKLRFWPVVVGILFAIIALGAASDLKLLFFAPMFLIGVVLAANWDSIRPACEALLAKFGRWFAPALLTLAVLSLSLKWTLIPLGLPSVIPLSAQGVTLIGLMVILLLAMTWPPFTRFLQGRVVQWLGAISFSLYLIHEPIVIAVGVLLGPELAALTLPIALLIVLPFAWLFFLLVERPAIRLSRYVGSRLKPVEVVLPESTGGDGHAEEPPARSTAIAD